MRLLRFLAMRADSNVHISLQEAALYDYPEMALLRDSTRAHTRKRFYL